MKKLAIFSLILSSLLIVGISLTGCAYTMQANVYPVSGPITKNPSIIQSTYIWDGSGHGKISMAMPDGELCQGEYTTLADMVTSSGNVTVIEDSEYKQYYGNSFTTADKQHGQGMLIGNKGTIMQLDYYVSATSGHGYGIAKDNKKNIYKVLF